MSPRRGLSLIGGIPDADRPRLDAILNTSAVNLRDRSAAWQKSGWKSFDPDSQPYGADEVQKERQTLGIQKNSKSRVLTGLSREEKKLKQELWKLLFQIFDSNIVRR